MKNSIFLLALLCLLFTKARAQVVLTPCPSFSVCTGATTSDPCFASAVLSITGGTWSSSNTAVLTVSSSGVLTGVSAGTAFVSYTVLGFPTVIYRNTVTVYATPVAHPAYQTLVCAGGTLSLSANDTGAATYLWTGPNGFSSTVRNPSISSVTSAANGTYTLTATSSAGCSYRPTLAVALRTAPLDISINQTAPFTLTGDKVHTYSGSGFTLQAVSSPVLPASGSIYTWSGPVAQASSLTTFSPVFTPTNVVAMHPYTLAVTYNGCAGSVHDTILVPDTTTRTPYNYFSVNGYRNVKGLGNLAGCSTCADVQPFHTIISSSLTSSNVANGENYYIPFSVACHKPVLTNNNFFMGDSTYVRIDSGSSVEMNHCHFFSNNWIGIIVNQGMDTTTSLKVTGSTLIENAGTTLSNTYGLGIGRTGAGIIVWPTPGGRGRYYPGMPDILQSDGVIYNRNVAGIYIYDYQPSLSSAPAGTKLPFTIKNNVFTGKELARNDTGSIASRNYPFSWPTVTTLKTVTAYNTIPTYALNAYRYAAGAYAAVAAVNVGSAQQLTPGNTVTPATYAYNYLHIGDNTADPDSLNSNLCDSLMFGVSAISSNVKMYNNRFRNIFSTVFRVLRNTGDTSTIHDCQIVGEKSNNTNNRFYNCGTGINISASYPVDPVWDFTCRNAYFASVLNVAGMTMPGLAANITLHGDHNTIQISDNQFYRTGGIMATYRLNGNRKGTTRISKNQIVYKTDTASTLISRQGVYFTDAGTDTTGKRAAIYIDSNEITGTITGIFADGPEQAVYINDNKIKVYPAPAAAHASWIGASQSIGIVIGTAPRLKEVKRNNITGIGYNCTQYDGLPLTAMSFRSVGTASEKADIQCNLVQDINYGISFTDTNYVNLRTNEMRRNSTGIYITGVGIRMGYIGAQGNTDAPSDNRWTTTGGTETNLSNTSFTSWSGSAYMIYTNYTNALASPFYVRSGAPYQPTYNRHTSSGAIYVTTNGSVAMATGDPASDCGPTYAAKDAASVTDDQEEQQPTLATLTPGTMHLFPNPSNGSLTITMANAPGAETSIKVVNSVGTVVYSSMHTLLNGRTDLDLHHLAPGMYIIQLTGNNTVSTGRVMIVK